VIEVGGKRASLREAVTAASGHGGMGTNLT
jgi:hypothetical protein